MIVNCFSVRVILTVRPNVGMDRISLPTAKKIVENLDQLYQFDLVQRLQAVRILSSRLSDLDALLDLIGADCRLTPAVTRVLVTIVRWFHTAVDMTFEDGWGVQTRCLRSIAIENHNEAIGFVIVKVVK